MKKDAYYFPHDSNATNDPKIIMLIAKWGLEAYGIFWTIIEHLREQPGYKSHLSILKGLAARYGSTEEKYIYVVRDFDLFTIKENSFFFSPSLKKRMKPLEEKREQRRLAGIRSGEARRLKAHEGNDRSTTVQHSSNENEQSKVKESKVKESKESKEKNLSYERNSDDPPTTLPPAADGDGATISSLKHQERALCAQDEKLAAGGRPESPAGASKDDKWGPIAKYEWKETHPAHVRFAFYFWSKFKALYPKHKKIKAANMDKWSNDIRLMVEHDERDYMEMKETLDWLIDGPDDFWRTTIFSINGFRKNYDQIRAKMKRLMEKEEKENPKRIKLRKEVNVDELE